MKIGMKLKQGRADKNLTQEEAANILNVSRSTISSWEVNRTYPDLDMLVSLSDLYDILLDVMLREDDKMVQTLSHEIQTSRKRKNWNIGLGMLYIPILLFLIYLLWNRNHIISANQTELFSLGGTDSVIFLMIEIKWPFLLTELVFLIGGIALITSGMKVRKESKSTALINIGLGVVITLV